VGPEKSRSIGRCVASNSDGFNRANIAVAAANTAQSHMINRLLQSLEQTIDQLVRPRNGGTIFMESNAEVLQ